MPYLGKQWYNRLHLTWWSSSFVTYIVTFAIIYFFLRSSDNQIMAHIHTERLWFSLRRTLCKERCELCWTHSPSFKARLARDVKRWASSRTTLMRCYEIPKCGYWLKVKTVEHKWWYMVLFAMHLKWSWVFETMDKIVKCHLSNEYFCAVFNL